MSSSAVRTYSDPDDYGGSIGGSTIELTVVGRGDFHAKLTRIYLQRLWMQRFSEHLPRIAEGVALKGRDYIIFRTQPGPSLLQAGVELSPSAIFRLGQTPEFYERSSGPANFASMSLPTEEIASIGEVMAGLHLIPAPNATVVTPPRGAMSRLQRLHAAAGDLAESAPEIIANPDAARGLEQALIEAMVACLGGQDDRETSLAQGQHALVMRRFRRVVEENPEQPLYIPDICKAIRVSERTLRMCCQEHLGMAPKRYLLLRRMHLVRRALHEAASDATSVTDIATRYGFWQLGRFAVEYQALFGEAPSATLRRRGP
ncbi:MAG: helix-turn-helix domain-containing protein [Alphaproteobacteria bacterium]|nr:helix-turn-helix domain-containing protein [Alphaproteobacteria bacterium]